MEWLDTFPYLGHLFQNNLCLESDINRVYKASIQQNNLKMCRFGTKSPAIKRRLFMTFCSSSYGAHLWGIDLPKNDLKKLSAHWLVCIRKAFSIPKNSLKTVSHLVSGFPEFTELLQRRRCGFAARLLAHGNDTVKRVFDNMVDLPGSLFARSLVKDLNLSGFCYGKLSAARCQWQSGVGKLGAEFLSASPTLDDTQRAAIGKDIFQVQYGNLTLPSFTVKETRYFFTSFLLGFT